MPGIAVLVLCASVLPGATAQDHPWRCDPVPLPIPEQEFNALEAGLAQRARLLETEIEIGENTLSSLWPEIGNRRFALQCSNVGLEHQVKRSRLRERARLIY